MREREDANVLHRSDNDFNRNVVDTVKATKRANTTRDLIDYLGGAKTWSDIEEHTEWQLGDKLGNPINVNTRSEYSHNNSPDVRNTNEENIVDKVEVEER